jgi:hypothetical protein
VQVADDRAQADDALAVELDDEPEDAVGRGVVRPEVDLEDVAAAAELLRHLQDRGDRRGDARALVDAVALRCDRHLLLPGEPHRLAADRVVLA